MVENFPFMLRLSKHSEPIFSNLLSDPNDDLPRQLIDRRLIVT